jgi:hypothetical protein
LRKFDAALGFLVVSMPRIQFVGDQTQATATGGAAAFGEKTHQLARLPKTVTYSRVSE